MQEWWLGIRLHRINLMKSIAFCDTTGKNFHYSISDTIQKQLFDIDRMIRIPEPIANPRTRSQYLVRSLFEEAITSSQLEGAATTRNVAKEMLRTGRPPRDVNEKMILNNFLTMQKIQQWKDQALSEELILEMHRQVTDQTLDKPDAAGRLRKASEIVRVEDATSGEILHIPPSAKELPGRLKAMCDFANEVSSDLFIHPMIRAIILHFWLAYDHPFVDGNGRTARALFYWLMLRNGYWIFEYISISEVILRAPIQYAKAFLHTETDANDLTYFIIHQSRVITQALSEFKSVY